MNGLHLKKGDKCIAFNQDIAADMEAEIIEDYFSGPFAIVDLKFKDGVISKGRIKQNIRPKTKKQ